MVNTNIDRSYLSSINFLDKRDILNQLLDLYEEEKTIVDMMEMTGRSKLVVQPEYHNFVNDWLYKPATIAAGSTAAASLVTDSDGYSTGDIEISAAADAPVVGEQGMQPATGSIFLVVAVSGTTVSVKSLNTVASGDAAYTADWTVGDTVVFFSNAYGEGAEANRMRKSNMIKELNYIQIFQQKYGITNLAHGSQIEVSFGGKDYFMLKQQHDAWRKHQMDKAFQYILGKRGKTLDADGNTVYTTEGVDHYISDRGGILHTVTVPGIIDKSELRAFSRVKDRARCPDQYWVFAGGEVDNELDDLLGTIEETKSGGINYNSFGKGDAKKKAIDLGVNSFRIYGRHYHKKRFQILDHPQVTWVNDNTGNNISKYPGYAYFLPTNKIKVDNGTDGGGMQDRFCTRYMMYPDGKNTRYSEIHLGGLAGTPTDGRGVLEIQYTSIEGLMCLGVQHFARLDMNDVSNY